MVVIRLADALGVLAVDRPWDTQAKFDSLSTSFVEDVKVRVEALEKSIALHKLHCLKLGFSVHTPAIAAVLAADSSEERNAALLVHQVAGAARHASLASTDVFSTSKLKVCKQQIRYGRKKHNSLCSASCLATTCIHAVSGNADGPCEAGSRRHLHGTPVTSSTASPEEIIEIIDTFLARQEASTQTAVSFPPKAEVHTILIEEQKVELSNTFVNYNGGFDGPPPRFRPSSAPPSTCREDVPMDRHTCGDAESSNIRADPGEEFAWSPVPPFTVASGTAGAAGHVESTGVYNR